jgi:hypothetical protein
MSMTDNLTDSIEQKPPVLVSGIDIFHGLIMSPAQILNTLSNSDSFGSAQLMGAVVVVVGSALADISMNSQSSITGTGLALSMLGSLIGKIIFWCVLAFFLRMLAVLLRQTTSISSCFMTTGWAFMPLLFMAVATCFSNATIFGDAISCCFAMWFLILELLAFDAVLKLGRFKTLGVILILPPCLFFAYFICMIFAGTLLSDGLF